MYARLAANVGHMAKIHPGATLTPHFRDFLPAWVARQSWYPGTTPPALSPVGYFRFDDPAGEVGIETHLLTDGSALFQLPMAYRGAPLADGSLVATAEHSVLGPRWIYDAETDPVWVTELLRLVRTGGVSDPSGRRGIGSAEARGRLTRDFTDDTVRIDLARVVTPGEPVDEPGVAGVVTGTWQPHGSGCLAVVRAR